MHENDIFMHENDIVMHENDIVMHENENIAPWVISFAPENFKGNWAAH